MGIVHVASPRHAVLWHPCLLIASQRPVARLLTEQLLQVCQQLHTAPAHTLWLAQARRSCKRGQLCLAAQALLNNLEAELAGPSVRGAHASAAEQPAEPLEAAQPADAPAADAVPAQAGVAAEAAGVPAAEGEAPGEPAGEPAGEGGGAGETEGAAAGRVARVTSDSVSMASETGEARGGDEDAGGGGAGAAGTSGQVRLCVVPCVAACNPDRQCGCVCIWLRATAYF